MDPGSTTGVNTAGNSYTEKTQGVPSGELLRIRYYIHTRHFIYILSNDIRDVYGRRRYLFRSNEVVWK